MFPFLKLCYFVHLLVAAVARLFPWPRHIFLENTGGKIPCKSILSPFYNCIFTRKSEPLVRSLRFPYSGAIKGWTKSRDPLFPPPSMSHLTNFCGNYFIYLVDTTPLYRDGGGKVMRCPQNIQWKFASTTVAPFVSIFCNRWNFVLQALKRLRIIKGGEKNKREAFAF